MLRLRDVVLLTLGVVLTLALLTDHSLPLVASVILVVVALAPGSTRRPIKGPP